MKKRINEILLNKINSKTYPGVDMAFVENYSLLHEEFGFDSLDIMEVIIECEGAFGRRIPDDRAAGVRTKEDIYNLFEDAN